VTHALADKKGERRAADQDPDQATPTAANTTRSGPSLPGLANESAGLTFARSWAEVVKAPPAMARAVAEHRRSMAQIGPLRRALAKRHLPGQILAELNRRLDEIEHRLADAERTEVDLENRQRVIDLVTGTFALMTAIWNDALAAEQEAKRREEAEEEERRRQEEEKNKLPEDFAGKAQAYGKAKTLAEATAGAAFAATSSVIASQKQASLEALEATKVNEWDEKPKGKRKQQPKKKSAGQAAQQPQQVVPDPKAAIELVASTATKDAEETRGNTVKAIIGKLGSVASSPAGRIVEDASLVEIFDLGKGQIPLCQALTDVAATPGGLRLARAVAAEADPLAVGQECLKLIHLKVDPGTVIAPAKLLVRSGPGTFASWLYTLIGTPAFMTATKFAGEHLSCLHLVAKVVPLLGADLLAHDLVGWLGQKKEKGPDIDWLLSCRNQATFPPFVRTIINGDVAIADFRQIFTTAGAKFTFDELTPLCQSYRTKLPQLVATIAEADPHELHYVQKATSIGTISPTLKTALRAESMLFHHTPNFTLTARAPQHPSVVNDIPYGRHHTNPRRAENNAGDNRTGFLRLNFPTAPTLGYIHTHWMAAGTSGVITSMHVKSDDTVDGVKGTELNDFAVLFTLLPAEIARVQNAAPHTGPALVWVPKAQ